MRNRRFRLRSMMILVFVSGLGLAAFDQIRRAEPIDWDAVREGSILFVPFLILVVLKAGLIFGARARRHPSGESPGWTTPHDPHP